MKKWIVGLLALILLAAVILVQAETTTVAPEAAPAATAEAASPETTEAAETVPPMESVIGAFSSVDLSGNTVNSNIFADSKMTLVNVWATFCGYCIDEMPDLAKLDSEYEDLQVLGILGDAGTNEATDPTNLKLALEIVEQTGANYVSVLPDSAINENLLQYIYSYPTSFFVDQNGQIVGKAIAGAMGYDDWKKVIDDRFAKLDSTGTAEG